MVRVVRTFRFHFLVFPSLGFVSSCSVNVVAYFLYCGSFIGHILCVLLLCSHPTGYPAVTFLAKHDEVRKLHLEFRSFSWFFVVVFKHKLKKRIKCIRWWFSQHHSVFKFE